MSVEIKKYIVVPRDAMECLLKRFIEEQSAIDLASDLTCENGLTHYVLEIKASVCREAPPVRVKRFE